jgi:hypothetical protein
MRQYKVREAFAIGSEDTWTNLMRCRVEHQPLIHDGKLLHLGLKYPFRCFTCHGIPPVQRVNALSL